MTSVLQQVPLTDIALDDDRFIVTYRPDLQALQQSVARAGVVTPVQLRRVDASKRLQMVCGWKRLRACRRAEHTRVPALIHEAAALSEEQAFLLAVYDNLGCRRFNQVEKGRILLRLQERFGYDQTELVRQWCPLLELPPRAETLAAYCRLVRLDDALQIATVEGALPLQTALWIGGQPPLDRQALLALFTGLKLGSNRARELATLIDDICLRDDCGAAELLARLEVAAILADTRLAGPQKLDRVRGALQAARYPLLHAHEQRFRDAVRQLRLPSPVRLRHPPYFEGSQYQVSFGFGSRQELLQVAQRLLDAASHEVLDELLALL